MIGFVTFDDIERLSAGLPDKRQIIARAEKREGKTTFLSHSSKDDKHLPFIIHLLENHGATVYVDVKDDSMPSSPSAETAKILRDALRGCRKFIVFVTSNSKDSKWIPWELGLGDGEKRQTNVALLPVAKTFSDQAWANQEYLGLYDRIIWGNFQGIEQAEWLVHNHHDNTAVRLREWLSR